MNRAWVVGVLLVLSGCASSRALDRRAQIRLSNAAAHRPAGAPVVEVVLDSESQWPVADAHRCAPLLTRLPSSMVKAGEFEVLAAAEVPRAALEGLLSTFACDRGWAAITLGEPTPDREGQARRRGTFSTLVPELKVAFSAPEFLAAGKDPGCVLPVFRTPPPERYVELVTLFLVSDHDQASAQKLLQEHACALGADGLIVTQEAYDLPRFASVGAGWTAGTPGSGAMVQAGGPLLLKVASTRVTATAIGWSKEKARAPVRPDQT